MRILAIDPGSSQSAWVTLELEPLTGEAESVDEFGIEPNDQLLAELRLARDNASSLTAHVTVIEWTAPRGMPASAELFETMWWAGRFAEALQPRDVRRLNRLDVKRHLCGTTAARDSNVHAALVDRFGGAGGKAAAVGLKASPGPLYGVKRDVWAALAVAVTWADQHQGELG